MTWRRAGVLLIILGLIAPAGASGRVVQDLREVAVAASSADRARICMVDDGVRPHSPVVTATSVNGQSERTESFGHGARLAAAIADPRYGTFPSARIVSMQVPVVSEMGGIAARDAARAIDRCRRTRGVRIVLFAYAFDADPADERLAPLTRALRRLVTSGIWPVVSVGNNGMVQYPATLPGVIGIAATDERGGRCGFSPARGAAGVDMVALGCTDARTLAIDGTSVAAARAAGLLAFARISRPEWSQERVLRVMSRTSPVRELRVTIPGRPGRVPVGPVSVAGCDSGRPVLRVTPGFRGVRAGSRVQLRVDGEVFSFAYRRGGVRAVPGACFNGALARVVSPSGPGSIRWLNASPWRAPRTAS